MDNLATLWEAVADHLPDRDALVQGRRRHCWRAFDDRAARLAAALGALGVGREGKVGLLLYNGLEYVEALHAAFKVRAVPVNVNYRYQPDELVELLDDAGVEVLLFHGSLAERVAAARARLPRLRAVIQVDDGSPPLDGSLDYEELVATHPAMARIARSGDDLLILYTGGTTGRPRGVVWCQAALWTAGVSPGYALMGVGLPTTPAEAAGLAAGAAAQGLAPILLPASPLIHGTALLISLVALCLGGTLVLLEGRSFDASEAWSAVEQEGVTHMAIVGDVFARPLLRALEAAETADRVPDTSSLTRITSSGTMLSAASKRGLAQRGITVRDVMGSSEGGAFADHVTAPGDDGVTATFQLSDRAAVFTPEGRRVEAGSDELGQLALGGALPLGYHNDPEKTARTFRVIDGRRWSIPGDWARVLGDGTIVLLGRGSGCINTGGEKVFPEEVEEAIKLHPDVDDCLVVGIPHDEWGEQVTAVIAPCPGLTVDGAEITRWLRGRLAGHKHPRRIAIVERMERSPAGKPDYGWARERVLGTTPAP